MSELTDRITAVLREHEPYEAIDGNLYCRNHDCRPTTSEEAETWDWAAHVAEQIAALFTEEVRELPDGMASQSTNMKTGETTHHFRPCTRQRRWVSAWTNLIGALEVS